MSFFRSLNDSSDDWAMDYLNNGILPSNRNFMGIGALKKFRCIDCCFDCSW
jgi:hypothetical protein